MNPLRPKPGARPAVVSLMSAAGRNSASGVILASPAPCTLLATRGAKKAVALFTKSHVLPCATGPVISFLPWIAGPTNSTRPS